MRYAYCDLGSRPAGSTAVVHWRGSGADVFLLDAVNFCKYRETMNPVFYSGGGRYGRAPARLAIPDDGHWYVVVDFRGPAVKAEPAVEMLEPQSGEEPAAREERPLVVA